MFKHVLIASDGSQLAQKAETAGLKLAKQIGAQVTAVTVTEAWDSISMAALAERNIANPVADYEESVAAEAKRILQGVGEEAKKVGVVCTTVHIKDSQPAAGIIVTAKERGCDLIVMASHGRRGISRALLGSQATKVVTLSSVPVLVCR
jgi:nucleotide-binding universal stress UspA family protein